MSELTIKAFVAQEHSAFENFNGVLAARIEEAWTRSLTKRMIEQLADKDSARVALPWGTYYAEKVAKGEAGNIAPKWEPSKGFREILNNDIQDPAERSAAVNMDEIDGRFLELFREFVAYGTFNHDDPALKDELGKNKGLRIGDDEAIYFLNEYALVLANLAREKQRDGKIFRLEINNGFAHGVFDFEYDDDEVKVTWTADKTFKQMLKDDDAASYVDDGTFTEVKGSRRTETDLSTGKKTVSDK